MHILITGSAGFVGSNLAERLVRQGHYVTGVDCFTDYYAREIKERNLEDLSGHERFRLVEADLAEVDLVSLLRHGSPVPDHSPRQNSGGAPQTPMDYVFHLAAQPGVRGSWGRNFETYTRNNILVTQRLLEAAKEVPLKKLVYTSSSSIYGDAESFPTPEDLTPRPISPYGVTKLAAEQLCLLYWRNYGIPVACTRLFTVYGPRQRPDMAFNKFIRAMQNEDEVPIYGDGEQTRDFTFVGDAIDAIESAAFSDTRGEVFNVGGGSRVTVNRVLDILGEILGRTARRKYVTPQNGDARDTAADIRKASQRLGYQPHVTLEQGLRWQVAWAQQYTTAR
ncbi:MAG TPA: NAD-dependent epimerase/dehydratase family protein [Anaerolineae bacterium]